MGLLDQLNDVLLQTPRKYWGDKATSLGSLLSDSAATGAQAYGSANSPMAPEHANTLAGLLADFTPGLGDVKSAYDGMQSAREGDYLGAALGGLGALPLVPNLAGMTKGEVEKIIGAAFKELSSGRVVGTGNIHLRNNLPDDWNVYDDVSGFVTNSGRFLDREEAMKFVSGGKSGRLMSEQLGSGNQNYRPKEFYGNNLRSTEN